VTRLSNLTTIPTVPLSTTNDVGEIPQVSCPCGREISTHIIVMSGGKMFRVPVLYPIQSNTFNNNNNKNNNDSTSSPSKCHDTNKIALHRLRILPWQTIVQSIRGILKKCPPTPSTTTTNTYPNIGCLTMAERNLSLSLRQQVTGNATNRKNLHTIQSALFFCVCIDDDTSQHHNYTKPHSTTTNELFCQ